MRRLHPFLYFTQRRDKTRGPKVSALRDQVAQQELMGPLFERDFRPGKPILNHPPEQAADSEEGPLPELFSVDLSFVEPGSYLFQTTRPPMDDAVSGARRKIERGYTDLEERTFEVFRRYFERCSRDHVLFSHQVRQLLVGVHANRREIVFNTQGPAFYQRMNAVEGKGPRRPPARRTAAFFLRTEDTWDGGPGLIAAFGMDSESTQAWACRLAQDFAYLLDKPCFAVVEMTVGDVPTRFTDLSWASTWDVELLVEMPA